MRKKTRTFIFYTLLFLIILPLQVYSFLGESMDPIDEQERAIIIDDGDPLDWISHLLTSFITQYSLIGNQEIIYTTTRTNQIKKITATLKVFPTSLMYQESTLKNKPPFSNFMMALDKIKIPWKYLPERGAIISLNGLHFKVFHPINTPSTSYLVFHLVEGERPLLEKERDGDPTPTHIEEKININTASNEELQRITGVGPAIAGRIIAYRETYGAFLSIEDIMEVSGIGEFRFGQMKDQIKVGD